MLKSSVISVACAAFFSLPLFAQQEYSEDEIQKVFLPVFRQSHEAVSKTLPKDGVHILMPIMYFKDDLDKVGKAPERFDSFYWKKEDRKKYLKRIQLLRASKRDDLAWSMLYDKLKENCTTPVLKEAFFSYYVKELSRAELDASIEVTESLENFTKTYNRMSNLSGKKLSISDIQLDHLSYKSFLNVDKRNWKTAPAGNDAIIVEGKKVLFICPDTYNDFIIFSFEHGSSTKVLSRYWEMLVSKDPSKVQLQNSTTFTKALMECQYQMLIDPEYGIFSMMDALVMACMNTDESYQYPEEDKIKAPEITDEKLTDAAFMKPYKEAFLSIEPRCQDMLKEIKDPMGSKYLNSLIKLTKKEKPTNAEIVAMVYLFERVKVINEMMKNRGN